MSELAEHGGSVNQLAEDYFSWLYARVFRIRDLDSTQSYSIVCDRLNRFEFNTRVPHDDNRAAEGISLRNEFLDNYHKHVDADEKRRLLHSPASVFEVLVALAERSAFHVEVSGITWFEIFLKNLKIAMYYDRAYKPQDVFRIDRAIEKFNDRRYTSLGRGGIFPLNRPADEDQRQVELWYQFATYTRQNHMY